MLPAFCKNHPAFPQFAGRDRFGLDWHHHHAFPREPSVPEICQIARQLAGRVLAFGLWNRAIGFADLFAPIVSGVRRPVPGVASANDTGRAFRRLCLWHPQTRSWRGSLSAKAKATSTGQAEHGLLARPFDWSIAQSGNANAAWQSTFDASLHELGARNASEIVMLTCRTLQRSRFAMLATFAFGSSTSSLSQRRPRAIDVTNVARVSERMGTRVLRRDRTGQKSHGAALTVSSATEHEWYFPLARPYDRICLSGRVG